MKKKIKKKFFLYSGIFFLFCIGYLLVLNSFRENIVFFITPTELLANKQSEKKIMLGGYVKEGSYYIEKEANGINVHFFVVTDFKHDIKVSYVGQLPSLFREKQGVIVQGTYQCNGDFFAAREVLAKHDEKYKPPVIK